MQALTVKVPLNLRNFLIMILKNAVNAALLSAIQIYHDPADNNFHNWHGIKGILWQVGAAILAREGVILIPRVLKWSNTNDVIGGTMKSIIIFALLLLSTATLHAQTPSLGQYQLGMGYASVGGPTDNGTLLTFSKQFSPRVWGQAKGFLLANPSGVTIATVGPRYRPPLSAIWKASKYFDTTKFLPFVDLNLGTVKDVTGAAKFAYGVGAGLDYVVAPNVTLLLIEADYDRSNFFPAGGILVTNIHTVTSGLKFTF